MKRKRALLGSNPPRNSRLETHSDRREPIGTGRLPPLVGCRATIFVGIGVDLPIPKKTHPNYGAMVAGWRVAIPVRNGVQARQRRRSALDPVPASGRSRGSTVA